VAKQVLVKHVLVKQVLVKQVLVKQVRVTERQTVSLLSMLASDERVEHCVALRCVCSSDDNERC
jgi:hypothetical protein